MWRCKPGLCTAVLLKLHREDIWDKTFFLLSFTGGEKKAPSYIFPEFSSYCENFLIFCYFWIQGLPVFNCKFVICIMLWFLEFELFVYCFGEEIQIKMGHLVTLTKKNKYSGAHHYNPRLVYLLPPFWSPFLFYQLEGFFFRKWCPYVWLVLTVCVCPSFNYVTWYSWTRDKRNRSIQERFVSKSGLLCHGLIFFSHKVENSVNKIPFCLAPFLRT